MPMYLTRFSYTPETWARLAKHHWQSRRLWKRLGGSKRFAIVRLANEGSLRRRVDVAEHCRQSTCFSSSSLVGHCSSAFRNSTMACLGGISSIRRRSRLIASISALE